MSDEPGRGAPKQGAPGDGAPADGAPADGVPADGASVLPAREVVVTAGVAYREYARNRDGMVYAMSGGLWMHHHVWKGTPMAHLVSTDRELLLAYGRHVGLPAHGLQYKPLRDPRTGVRREAWHWDLMGPFLPERPDES